MTLSATHSSLRRF